VVWVGRETDLPLVAKGLTQAVDAAQALRRAGLVPDVVYAASLMRTQRFAEIVAETLGLPPPITDSRLDELDYGRWAGRTNDEIAGDGPAALAAMQAWNAVDAWPERAGWGSRWADVQAAIAGFAAERLDPAGQRRALVVSSNGILRFLPRLLLGSSRDSFKMRTGHLGVIDVRNGESTLRCWDVAPAELG
jgi:broad specificity phosphatase PhoE